MHKDEITGTINKYVSVENGFAFSNRESVFEITFKQHSASKISTPIVLTHDTAKTLIKLLQAYIQN